jgi:hypothetical protein
MHRLSYLTLLIALLLIFGGCGPKTKIVNVWKPPEYRPEPFSKVVAVAITRDEIVGRIAEDEFVGQLKAETKGITGYSVIPKEARGKTDEVKEILSQQGVDGAVVFRLANIDQNIEYSPGQAYTNFYGYYGWAWTTTYTPSYIDVKRVISVEATVYRVADGKIVWSGHSQSTDPESTRKMIDDMARLVFQELQKDGLVR